MPNDDLSVDAVAVEDMARGEQATFNDHVATELRAMKAQLGENTQRTQDIYDIVLLFRGVGEFFTRWGDRIRRFTVWVTPIGAGIYGLWHWWNEYRKTKGG